MTTKPEDARKALEYLDSKHYHPQDFMMAYYHTIRAVLEQAAKPLPEGICSKCRGDGIERCDNPDHGFICTIPDVCRMGCPCCGHDEEHRMRSWKVDKWEWNECPDCSGTGKITAEPLPDVGEAIKEIQPIVIEAIENCLEDDEAHCLEAKWITLIKAATRTENKWQPIETAPYSVIVVAWIHLPKNPPASGAVIAQRCQVEKDESPEEFPDEHLRRTVGCWWANGRYYPAGYVTHWQPLPEPPKETDND